MINPNVYIVDFAVLVKQLCPTFLRKNKFIGFLTACYTPLKSLYNRFIMAKNDGIYKVSHNSQVCYMQKVLNDRFDTNLRRIKIKNAVIREPNWLYVPEDNKPKYFYDVQDNEPRYLYNQSDFIGDGVDFIVLVPIALKPLLASELIIYETEMKALVNYYKLYSKNYAIRYE